VNQDPSWTAQNYLSIRALRHAASVRTQLCALLQRTDIHIDTSLSCKPEREPFLRCLTHGLFLNVAKRVVSRDAAVVGGVKNYSRSNNNASTTGMPFNGNSANSGAFRNVSFGRPPQSSLDASEAPYRTVRGGQPVHIHPSSVLFSAPSGE
jgi:hypothetical protein